ncbi:hypothetical protein [Rheinheimera faecalis]|uniref:hypothetical protein n=1 Tax=Rheinheimera faecalis TaxID=2901141 RepID=UPI001E546E7E|nr:hypothetical protein [Rheinheimera faecalis]
MNFVIDESLQSWIYRCLYSYGQSDFSAVVGCNGFWNKRPFFPKGINFRNKAIPDKKLVEFLKLSGFCAKKADPFENPIKYVVEANYILQGQSRSLSKKGQLAIAYCSSCIKESIESIGFGYFKADWLYGEGCKIHGSDLSILSAANRTNALKQLRFVLCGLDIDSEQNSKKNTEFLTRQESASSAYYVMPCILDEFFKVASSPISGCFPGSHYVRFYHPNGKKKELSKYELNFHYLDFQSKYREEFVMFLEKRAEIINHKYGINEVNSFSEKLIKKRGVNCSKCSVWAKTDYCPIKPIQIVNLDSDLNWYARNPCDFASEYSCV